MTSGPVDSFCVVAKPIFLTSADVLTEATLRGVLAHDEKGAKLCGWKPPG